MSAAQPDPAKRPVRVVSLLPSATEMLHLLGAEIVGRSHECDWPPSVRDRVPALTGAHNKFENSAQMHDAVTASLSSGRGLYWLDAERLAELRPDAIVTQSLCSVCAVDLDIVRRAAAKIFPQPRIIDTNPMSLQHVIDDMRRLGRELGLVQRGEEVAAALQARADRAVALASELSAAAPPPRPKRVVFLEWTAPLFPGGHWTPQMIHLAGGICPVNPPRDGGAGGAAPSRETDPSEVVAADPDLIIVAPCGLDLETTRREVAALEDKAWWRSLRAVQSGRVALVDGNQHFNRPGPRLVDALEWLVALLADRADLMAPDFPWEWLPQLPAAAAPPQAAELAAEAAWGPGELVVASGPEPYLMYGSSAEARLRPLGPEASSASGVGNSASSSSLATAAAAAAAAALSPPNSPLRAATRASLRNQESGPSTVQQSGDQGFCCSDGGGAETVVAASDPWVVACSPWAGAPHLPADIEDLHAAACEGGKSSYDDPETGFMVFTHVGLVKRGQCCANRCRHCPWGHSRVSGRPRLNRLTRPALLHPSPAAQRAWRHRCRRLQLERHAWQQQQQQQQQQLGAGRLAARPPPPQSFLPTAGGDGGGGLTLFCHEGCEASDAALRGLLAGRGATEGEKEAAQRVVLLVAFDVDTGALWGRDGAAAAAATAGNVSSHGGSRSGSASGGSGTSHHQQGAFDAVHISAAMDASLRHDLDLVVVPLQVCGRSWPRDPAAAQPVLTYVLRTAAELLEARSLERVVMERQQDGTPALFAQGTAGAVRGGWPELVRQVNADLEAQAS